MSGTNQVMFAKLKKAGFDILALHHAEAVLQHDMPDASDDIEKTLMGLKIPITDLVSGGGGETKHTQWLRKSLAGLGWKKKNIEVKKLVNGKEVLAQSHEIDHIKEFGPYIFALEIEWNNKDPFFDRDLESFKRLHSEGAISVACIITRGQSLQSDIRGLLSKFALMRKIANLRDLERFGYDPTKRQISEIERRQERGKSFVEAWVDAFASDKFGEATTHWRKLDDRVRRGVGNPCPLLLIGIPSSVVTF